MADSDSLIEGKGTVKKNIHWFIIGAVCIVMVAAIFMQDASSKKRKADIKAAQEEKVPQVDVANVSIEGVLDKQKEAAVENPADLAVKPGVPEIATEGVGKDSKEVDALSAQQAQAVEDAKRDAQLNGSSIMALTSESNAFEKFSGGSLPSPSEAPEEFPVNEEDLRKALAPATLDPEIVQAQALNTKQEQDNAWQEKLSNRKKTDAIIEDTANSPYTIFEGSVIPAVLMTKVSSQLPGQITGLVSQDVYDGVTGTHLVIPKGSALYGSYNNAVSQGQSRLQVSFTRLILPNGRTISLAAMPSADKTGQHGIEGDVNNRYFQRFGFSFFTAILGSIADRSSGGATTVINTDGGSGVSTAAGTILTDISRAEQQRASQIQPIVEIKQGEKFNINVNRDIAIAPYQ